MDQNGVVTIRDAALKINGVSEPMDMKLPLFPKGSDLVADSTDK